MTSRYLAGEFAPLHEEYTLTDLDVVGTIPDNLDGRYLRNGPNPIGEIDPELYHWFIGDGMVHGIRIREARQSGTAIAGFVDPGRPRRWANARRPAISAYPRSVPTPT